MKYSDVNFNNTTILITGGAGFIGSNLAFYFQKNYPKATIVILDIFRSNDRLHNGNLKSFGHYKNLIGFDGIVISGDINDKAILEDISKNYKFDYIFHQAAISDTTATEQDLIIKTNVNAFESIIKLAISHNANLVYASSAATYGDCKNFILGYENPNNPYGFSKLMMDNLAKKYIKQNLDISIVGLRYFNVYGPREFFKNKTASTIIQFAHQLLSKKSPKLFEKSDIILRDFVYIEDVIQSNILSCTPKKSAIFNVGTAKPRSFKDIVDILQKELHTNFPIQYIPNPYEKQYQFFTKADIKDTVQYLGYNPRFELEDGIKAYIPEIIKIFESEVKHG